MVGVILVSQQFEKAQKVKEILQKYFLSQIEDNLFIKNKYFATNVDLKIVDYQGLHNLYQNGNKVDCLVMIIQGDQLNQLTSQFKNITEKIDPISQVLVLDTDEDNINLEKFYDETECFVESVSFLIDKQHSSQKKELPKSITQDVDGMLRLIQILDSTSWRNASKSSSQKKQLNSTKQQKNISKSQKTDSATAKPNVYYEGIDNKLQQDMNSFSALMQQMLSFKNQNLPDFQRKQKAADLIMQLAASMGIDDDQQDV